MTTLRSPIASKRTSRADVSVFSCNPEVALSSLKTLSGHRKGALSGGKNSGPPSDQPVAVGRPRVQKLDENVYKPFGCRSRSSSDAGSDTSYCKGGPGKPVCGERVRNSDSGVCL